jgi:hypothetical protein
MAAPNTGNGFLHHWRKNWSGSLAMVCGCPVITSSVSACPEAAGEAAKIIDPRNIQALKTPWNNSLIKLMASDKVLPD